MFFTKKKQLPGYDHKPYSLIMMVAWFPIRSAHDEQLPEQARGKSEVSDTAAESGAGCLKTHHSLSGTIFKRLSVVRDGKPGTQKMMAKHLLLVCQMN